MQPANLPNANATKYPITMLIKSRGGRGHIMISD
jgi:hypothetical protein